LPEFLKKANVVATCRSEINLCELFFAFDLEAGPSLHTDSMNLVQQQGGLWGFGMQAWDAGSRRHCSSAIEWAPGWELT